MTATQTVLVLCVGSILVHASVFAFSIWQERRAADVPEPPTWVNEGGNVYQFPARQPHRLTCCSAGHHHVVRLAEMNDPQKRMRWRYLCTKCPAVWHTYPIGESHK